MKKIHIKRLKKLADHLQKPKEKFFHKRFDFDAFSIGEFTEKGYCGTAGCAIGECLAVFSRAWGFKKSMSTFPLLRRNSEAGSLQDAAKFFGLTFDECILLFTPRPPENSEKFPGFRLVKSDHSPKQVARNLLAFVKWKEKE